MTFLLCVILLSLVITDFACANTSRTTRSVDIPCRAPPDKQIVDANYQSYSIEFSYMLDFAGNNT